MDKFILYPKRKRIVRRRNTNIYICQRDKANKNTMDLTEFMCLCIPLNVLAYIVYRCLFFINLKNMTQEQSVAILMGIVLLILVPNLLLSCKKYRNFLSIFAGMFVPYGIYTVMTYFVYFSKLYRWLCVLAIGLGVFYLGCVFLRKIPDERGRSRIMKARIRLAYLGIEHIAMLVSVFLLMLLFGRLYVVKDLVFERAEMAQTYEEEQTVGENMEVLLKMQPKIWNKLETQQKLEVLQIIVNNERHNLGLDKPILVLDAELGNNTLGCYNFDDSTIQIDRKFLGKGSPRKVLEATLHEVFHAAQYTYVEIYDSLDEQQKKSYFMRDAAIYAMELTGYVKGEEDFVGYYCQSIETHARAYATAAVEDYYVQMEEYLKRVNVDKRT